MPTGYPTPSYFTLLPTIYFHLFIPLFITNKISSFKLVVSLQTKIALYINVWACTELKCYRYAPIHSHAHTHAYIPLIIEFLSVQYGGGNPSTMDRGVGPEWSDDDLHL